MRLHVQQFGDPGGEPLVCLHGLTGHSGRFRRLSERLPGRRLIAPDLRGHGASGYEPPWTVEQHVADVLETAPPADVAGFSFGGLVAATLAAAHPDRVRRLVLIDPSVELPADECLDGARLALDEEAFDSAEDAIDARYGGGTLFSTPREFLEEEMREHLTRNDEGRLRFRYEDAMAVTSWSEMARPAPPVADVPTLLITAAQSWVTVDVERWRRALGDRLEHVETPGGHSVLWDDLDAAAAAIRAFLG